MANEDTKRTDLHNCLRELMGTDMADTMMDYLPPVGWSDVVRRQDLDAAIASVRVDTSPLLLEIRSSFDQLRNDLRERASRNEASHQRLEDKMDSGFAMVNLQFEQVNKTLERMNRTIGLMITSFVAVAGVFATLLWQVR